MILRNLLRRKARSGLTILGVAVCIAMLVSLVSVAVGLREQINDFTSTGRADLIVSQKGAADPTWSFLPSGALDQISKIDGVATVYPLLMGVKQIAGDPLFFYYGTTSGSPVLEEIRIIGGHSVFEVENSSGGICLGDRAASHLSVSVGDTIDFGSEPLTVVGIFEASVPLLGAGGVLTLETAQRIAGHDRASFALIRANQSGDNDLRRLERSIETAVDGVEVVRSTRFASAFEEFNMIEDLVLILSLLTAGFGGIGVMNTMVMSVFERTREIGILQAIGWSRSMILRLVLLEGLLLCVFGGALGIAMGVGVVEWIGSIDRLSWMAGAYSVTLFGQSMLVAVAMGLLGTLYPVVRAVRISPVEALRYE